MSSSPSRPEQVIENLKALDGEAWSAEELARVDEVAFGEGPKAEN
ncbi:MAG: hypothetical protein U0J93_09005 [Parolsenella sp.]|nr:hypothetical protein [Parolsenella sp.]MEE1373494.1 hypothetical protein [Parolsenella sp.]